VTSDTTLVGCGPLAMAQLMKFYEYPTVGLENFSNTTYDWANMLAYDSLMTTQTQREAVARICRDAGISIGASYSDTLTTSGFDYIADGLARDFNYTSQMKTPATWYSPSNTAIWIDSLKASIDRGEPILYGGLFNFNSQMVDHAWIIDNYNSTQFNFNVGSEDANSNKWYPVSDITLDQNAIFHAIPDKNENALAMPYKENFQDVVTGTGINQIPKYIGVSHTVTPESLRTFRTYQDSLGNKSMIVRNSGDDSQWFVLKKINLGCDSIPVLKFRHKILDEYGLVGAGTTAMIIEISNDNRSIWNQVRRLDINNYNPDDWNKFVDNIISLNEFRNDTINVRFRFEYSGSSNFCLIDDIEVHDLKLEYTELVNDMILQPRTSQSIKITPSILTPPKSKGFEDYDMIVDFYIKEDVVDSTYVKVFTDSLLEAGIFEYPYWNTDDLLDKAFYIKAVARTKSNISTLDSTEVRVEIDGRQCHVDLPLPATESWFD
ncbi:MAG: C10 family peptidase, partial [Candidatus Delongbacteria bacterium]|nr:C10 family peptidase [Candidatus Delongbacteria bacterium]